MDERVAKKLDNHRRNGTTYPNAGSPAADRERQRLELKMARHKAAAMAEQALEEATKPEPANIVAEPKAAKPDDKGTASKRS